MFIILDTTGRTLPQNHSAILSAKRGCYATPKVAVVTIENISVKKSNRKSTKATEDGRRGSTNRSVLRT